MLTILVITGSLLDGSGKGMLYYIGSADTKKFAEPGVWKDAVRGLNKKRIKETKKINFIIYLDSTNFLCIISMSRWSYCNE